MNTTSNPEGFRHSQDQSKAPDKGQIQQKKVWQKPELISYGDVGAVTQGSGLNTGDGALNLT